MNIEDACCVEYINDLDSTINYLKNARDNNRNIYIDYKSENGLIRLYSVDISDDLAYQRVYGLTKEEKNSYDEELKSTNDKDAVHAKYQYKITLYFDRLRDDSTKLDFKGKNVYELIKTLNECKKLNKNIYIDYSTDEGDMPIRFYSMDLNIDREFLSIMGLTKSQYGEYKEKFRLSHSDKELKSVINDVYKEMIDKD